MDIASAAAPEVGREDWWRPGGWRLVEPLLAALVLAALAVAAWRFHQNGYLPQPFHYDSSASLMDLHTTAYWANRAGAYDIWHAIYPPLSFVLLRLATLNACYGLNAWAGRDCDWLARWALLAVFLLNVPLVFGAFRRLDRRTAAPRSIALCLGLPMLYGLERGNLLILSFTFFVLARGELLRSPIARWLAMAISLNIKPYLLVVVFPYLAHRRWRWLVGCGVASLAVYLISFVLEGAGTPLQLIQNVSLYARSRPGTDWSGLYYATSYWPLAHMMAAGRLFPGLLSPADLSAVQIAVTLLIRGAQLGAAACFVAACLRPAGVNANRFIALALAVVLTTITTGSAGYVQVFLFFLIFQEPWAGGGRIAMLVATYALCVPIDHVLWRTPGAPMHSWLGDRQVWPSFGISVGHFLRPAVLLVIQYALIVVNFRDVLRAPSPEPHRYGSDNELAKRSPSMVRHGKESPV